MTDDGSLAAELLPSLALQAHLRWADALEAGTLAVQGFSPEPGERVGVLVEDALLARLEVAAMPRVIEVEARGRLVATDRRVVVGDREVRWDDGLVGEVVTEIGGFGTLVSTPDRTALWGFVPPILEGGGEPPYDLMLLGLAQWMRVTACWYLWRDDLDAWRALTATWFAPDDPETEGI